MTRDEAYKKIKEALIDACEAQQQDRCASDKERRDSEKERNENIAALDLLTGSV